MEKTPIKSPLKALFFIITVLLMLLILSLIFPKSGIQIGDVSLSFIEPNQIFTNSQQPKVDISEIIEEPDTTSVVELVQDTVVEEKNDWLLQEQIKLEGKLIRGLEFPPDNPDLLFPLYAEMLNLRQKGSLMTFVHYGDSQLEQDRITNYFRHKIQEHFGGFGSGFVPAVQAFSFNSPMIQSKEGEWKRYTNFGIKSKGIPHSRYGIMGTFARFCPDKNPEDTTLETCKASLTFRPYPHAYPGIKRYSRCRMFIGNIKAPMTVKVFNNKELIDTRAIAVNPKSEVHSWNFNVTPRKLKFEFESTDSPEFYGFSFDTYKGIIVDNIPMRGASGLSIAKMDATLAAKIHKNLKTKLVIFQFGGNIVPSKLKTFSFYESLISNSLKAIKQSIPNVSIIVVGPADMSKKEDNMYVTYPNLTLVRDALKRAAFENNCAFWDLYEAMGGENSMPSWVSNDPPLGEKDYIHFTIKGAKYASKMFYNAFIADYNRYLSQLEEPKSKPQSSNNKPNTKCQNQ